jgi:hypothetical protein
LASSRPAGAKIKPFSNANAVRLRRTRVWALGTLWRKPSSNLEQQLLQDRSFEIIEAD